jgi:hypothetical protein
MLIHSSNIPKLPLAFCFDAETPCKEILAFLSLQWLQGPDVNEKCKVDELKEHIVHNMWHSVQVRGSKLTLLCKTWTLNKVQELA